MGKGTLLDQLAIPDDIDQLALAKTRFDGIDRDVHKRQGQLEQINEKAANLKECESHPEVIGDSVANVNLAWDELRQKLGAKHDEFVHGERRQKFVLDVTETELWIEEKITIIDTTRDYGDTLSGVLALQRKLGSLQRDVSAIQSKIAELNAEAAQIAQKYPEDAQMTNEKLAILDAKFQTLSEALKVREEKLGQAGHLQTFMRDAAEFQVGFGCWSAKSARVSL